MTDRFYQGQQAAIGGFATNAAIRFISGFHSY
jgi:hypothetical protein